MTKSKIAMALEPSEAIVLFEYLSRFSEQEKLEIADPAEAKVLWGLQCMLEKKLVDPLKADYKRVLSKAREKVRGPGELRRVQNEITPC